MNKQKHDFHFFVIQCIIKTIIRFGFHGIQNTGNQGLSKGYQLKRKASASAMADDPYLDLDYSGYHKNLIVY